MQEAVGSVSVATQALGFAHFFEVKLDVFSGPIDLLLHLVKQNELPIEKLSLAQVTSQYLDCIEKMRQFDLDVAGEYLVIAATLVSVKSSILLNEPVQLVDDGEGNLIDPHEELLRRLREAEIYQNSAKELGRRALLGVDVFPSMGTLNGVDAPPPRYKPHDSMLLGMAFKKLLEKAKDQPFLTFAIQQVSVVERMMKILGRLETAGGAMSFSDLIEDKRSRMSIIASFVALLELCKRQAIVVRQEKFDGDILIALASSSAAAIDTTSLRSEFDTEPGQSAEKRDQRLANA